MGAYADATLDRAALEGGGLFPGPLVSGPDRVAELGKRPLIVHVARRDALSREEGVDSPEFQRIHADLLCQHVHGRFEGKGDLGRSGPPRSAACGIVRVDQPRQDIHVGDVVGTGEHPERPHDHVAANHHVRTVIYDEIDVDGGQLPVLVRPQARLQVERVPLGGDEHRFFEARDIPNGPFEVESRGSSDGLRVHGRLLAELAARIGLFVADVLVSQGLLQIRHMQVDLYASARRLPAGHPPPRLPCRRR